MQQELENRSQGRDRPGVEEIRRCAVLLKDKLGGQPLLQEVAEALGVGRDELRSIVNNARRNENLTWGQLGITSGLMSPERIELTRLLRTLSTPLKKAVVVHEILELHRQRKLSRQAAGVLTYAVLSGESTYEGLDSRYSGLTGGRPRSISNLLHSGEIPSGNSQGAIESLDGLIRDRFRAELKEPTSIKRYREFAADYFDLMRLDWSFRPFSHFLTEESPVPEFFRAVEETLQAARENQIPDELKLSKTQVRILSGLAEQKASGSFVNIEALAGDLGLSYAAATKALERGKARLSAYDRLLSSSLRFEGGSGEGLRSAIQSLQQARAVTAEEKHIIVSALKRHCQLASLPTVFQLRVGEAILLKKQEGGAIEHTEIARLLGCTEWPIRSALDGRGSKRGLVVFMDETLGSSDPKRLDRIIRASLPEFFGDVDSICAEVASVPAEAKQTRQTKRRLLQVIRAILSESENLPVLEIMENPAHSPSRRDLPVFQKAEIICAYLEGRHGSIKHLAQSIGKLLGISAEIKVSVASLSRFLLGRKRAGYVRSGAILALTSLLFQSTIRICTAWIKLIGGKTRLL